MTLKKLIKQIQEIEKPLKIAIMEENITPINIMDLTNIKINEQNIIYLPDEKNNTHIIKKMRPSEEHNNSLSQLVGEIFNQHTYKIAKIYDNRIRNLDKLETITTFLNNFYKINEYLTNSIIKLENNKATFGFTPKKQLNKIEKEYFNNKQRQTVNLHKVKNIEIISYESGYSEKKLTETIREFTKDYNLMYKKQ